VTSGILPPPQYFAKNAMMNKNGYNNIDEVLKKGLVGQDVETFAKMAEHESTLVLDTRSMGEFALGHIPGALFIGIDGQFAPWVGALITDIEQDILLVTPNGREEEVVTRLARVGYDNVVGYLEGGFEAWKNSNNEVSTITSISATDLEKKISEEALNIIDVRKPTEYISEHVVVASNFPLDYIHNNLKDLDKNKTYHVHCLGGYRSMIANSILLANGVKNIVDITGGWNAIKETGIEVTDYVCPSTIVID
ncbi:MAG: rhodanese-like domain-containing protein, partial [Cyclobacteriaceae bacterium]|nr:rhodanese-like domain-containing protein [Cyclobacteriaceae bacterium]